MIAKGLAASPGAAVGTVYFTADDAVDGRRARREGHPRPQRDQPRGRARDDDQPGHPHRPRRTRQPRRRRRPRLGHAGHRRRRRRSRSAASRSPSATSPSTRATRSASTARTRRGHARRDGRSPPASRPPSSTTILEWADTIRKGKLGVRANADTGEDATKARELGAEGIGLCRTEHMFLAPDRLPVVREMILANTPEEEAAALENLAPGAADRLRGDPRGDGRPARHRPPARPAAARVPAVGRGAARSRRPRRASSATSSRPSCRPPRSGPSTTR